jgi:hypothetical protein
MAPTPPKTSSAQLQSDHDALRVLVKALAEIADQPRLKEATQQHKEEHLDGMEARGASDEQIADFMAAFERLQQSY